MDKIVLEGIHASAIIGTLPEERKTPQTLELDAVLCGDFRKAGMSDNLEDTFDYSRVESLIRDYVFRSQFYLLEALAEHLASEILKVPGIFRVKLRISKPGAARFARNIALEIAREKQN